MIMDKQILREILADQARELFQEQGNEIPRRIDIAQHLAVPEVSVLMGVRRSGKSTLLRQFARQLRNDRPIHYINFEEQKLARFTGDDFQSAYEEFLLSSGISSLEQHILIYDEIQLVEGWERWIAGLSSKHNMKIFITGSNSCLLSSELASLLTGRYLPLMVFPLSFAEIVESLEKENPTIPHTTDQRIAHRRIFQDYLTFGGFPRASLSKDTKILAQYHHDIVTKDIVIRKKIRSVSALISLGSLLASQNGRLFNKSVVAKELGIKNAITIDKYCDAFQETFLYSELRLFSRSRRKQLRGKSKFYAIDPLLAKEVGYHHGDSDYWVLENHVCNELLRRGYEVFYWHSQKGYEVDFIAMKKNHDSIAIQVCMDISRSDTLERELRSLHAAKWELEIEQLLIVTGEEPKEEDLLKTSIPTIPFCRWALQDNMD